MSTRLSISGLLLLLISAACGPKTLEQKTRYGEKVSEEADSHLRTAEGHLRALEPEKADDQLREARELLSEPEASLSPEAEIIRGRLDELTALLPSVRETRRKRDLDDAVRERRSKIGPILQAAKDATEDLSGKGLTEARVKIAKDAVGDLDDELDDDLKDLIASDQDFASYAKRARGELLKAKDELALSEAKLQFIAGPLKARDEGSEKVKAAKPEKDLEKKIDLLTGATASYQSCASTAATFAKKPNLAKSLIYVGNTSVLADAVATGCEKEKVAAQKQLEATQKLFAKKKPAVVPAKKKKKS